MSDTSVDVVDDQINQEESRTEDSAEDLTTVEEDDEEEDDEQCGFCIFMKGGGCKKEFVVSACFNICFLPLSKALHAFGVLDFSREQLL